MRLVIQRVSKASVTVDQEVVGEINLGLLVLVGLGREDTRANLEKACKKLLELRIFADQQHKFQFSALDLKAEILLVPQFTLYADTSKGRRPEFFSAMPPVEAQAAFNQFVEIVSQNTSAKVATGSFGAYMQVQLLNDGPVTICLNDQDLS